MGMALLVACISSAQAATVVNVQTILGDFKIELYEDLAPNTVARFLSDIEAGTYHFSMIHYAANSFFVGGRYVFNSCAQGPEELNFPASIAAEETGLANTTGTFAMVRDQSNPQLLTGEYLVNLGNNTASSPSTAPVVIGKVIEGLGNADRILDQWRVAMSISLSVPTVNYNGIYTVQCGFFTRDNLIQVSMSVESVDQGEAVNNFDSASQRLQVKVDAGSEGLLSLAFTIVETAPEVIIQAIPETVTALTATVDGIASYDPVSETLTLPVLAVDGVATYSNMVFKLTDAAQLQFTLQSFTQN